MYENIIVREAVNFNAFLTYVTMFCTAFKSDIHFPMISLGKKRIFDNFFFVVNFKSTKKYQWLGCFSKSADHNISSNFRRIPLFSLFENTYYYQGI